MKNNKNNLNIIRCKDLNIASLLNLCVENNITIKNITRDSSGFVEFGINDSHLKILKNIKTNNFTFEVKKIGGKKNIFNKFIYRIGLVVGFIISMIIVLFCQNRLFKIHISGLVNVSYNMVESAINDYGINKFSSLNFDKERLENYLLEKFDFSLVSIITKGNSLIINIKEELPNISDTYTPITADYNMIISTISVYSGTAMVKAGDIIYKGQTIVEPYIEKSGEKVFVTPCANITAKTFFSSNYEFKNSEEVLVSSGKKKLIDCKIYLGKYKLFGNSRDVGFEHYKLEENNYNVSKYFLPINIKKTYAYELVKKTINRDFEKEKESIIISLRKNVINQVNSELNISSEEVIVSEISTGYIVSVFVECDVVINYKYYN